MSESKVLTSASSKGIISKQDEKNIDYKKIREKNQAKPRYVLYTEQTNKNNVSQIKELNKTPIYVPFVSAYKKAADGSSTIKRFYSSIDAEIYFNNEFVENICDIQWQLQQASEPLYGFNSYTADEIAVGSRIINGQFSIRFTSPNYLFKILEIATQQNLQLKSGLTVVTNNRTIGEVQGTVDSTYSGQVSGTNTQELWPQTFDIDIIYGHPSRGQNDVHVVLEGVRILSCTSGAFSSTPVPVTEQYNFVAKDLKTLG